MFEDDDRPDYGPCWLPSNRLAFAIAILVILISFTGVVYYTTGANAHEWYDAWCCSEKDCAEIPQTSVRPIAGGFQITVAAGDHPLVTRVHVFQIEQSKVRLSPDGKFHLCLYPTEDTLRCFYAPAMGS